MSDESRHAESKDPRAGAAFREYLERLDRGEPVDREEFLARHAVVADALRALIAAEEKLRNLVGAQGPRESAGISTRSLAERGQETIPPKSRLDRALGTSGSGSGLSGRFGRYQIIRGLGKGAMGTVYLAEDTQLERRVAIKTPHFEDEPTGELLARFYREARAAATLRHANICPVYDVGEIDRKRYISMAYIEGDPLSTWTRADKPQTERQLLILIRKLALALQEAHDHGIVHRDLKPANIMVDKKGEPVIMDFGLARKPQKEGDASLTHSGTLLGSPAYMSPEQIEGDPVSVGPASDQYSLGVVLYETLTGQLPFRGSVVSVLAQIITKDATPPSVLRPGLDPRVEALCLRMMAKSAAERFPSMKAVADELAAIVKNPARSSEVERPTSANRAPTLSRGEADRSQARKSIKERVLTESDLASLEDLVRKCNGRRDYDQAIQIVERIPEERRSDAIQELLIAARKKADEIGFLICEINEAERLEDTQMALKKAEELLKIKPGHHRALAIQEKYSGAGHTGPARIGASWRLTERWDQGGWIPWSVLAFGVAVFGVMTGVIVIYLNKTAVVIDVEDPDVTVSLEGKQITITGPKEEKVYVEPGEQQLKISYAGIETVTKSFEIKRGEKKTVKVSILGKNIVALLENEALPLAAGTEKVGSSTGGAASKPTVAAARPKFFGKPFAVRGEWKIENDELLQPTLAMQEEFCPMLIFGDSSLSNYDLSVEVNRTGGNEAIGFRFHWLAPGDYRNFNIADGGADFSYVHDNKWGREPGNWKSIRHVSNQWYTLKIEARGSTFRAFEDGSLLFQQTDPRATHGRIFLYTWAAAARFRQIKVTDPEGKVLFEGLPELPPPSAHRPARVNDSQVLTAEETTAKAAQQDFAERTKTPLISTNSVGMKLALIPPGEFQMGSPNSEPYHRDDEHQHHVRITKPFYLGVYDVTQREFQEVLGRNPSGFRNSGGEMDSGTGPDTSRRPVETVTWFDAIEFCNKLSEKEGRPTYYKIGNIKRERELWIKQADVSIAGGAGYRLPTEAQWEYACRAGTTTPFNFGALNNGLDCNCNGTAPYGTSEKGPALGTTAPVGSYRPNAFGLYDMHGNVWQWCWDAYEPEYYAASPESDPPGPPAGARRVFRGGSWCAWNTPNCRSAVRQPSEPDYRNWAEQGFRVACDVAAVSSSTPALTNQKDDDRHAAEAVLALGGTVTIRTNGQWQEIRPGQTLPNGTFLLTRVALHDKPQLTDAQLEPLEGVAHLTAFGLSKAPRVTDAIISHLRNSTQLESFWFEQASVGDAGLVHLERFNNLKSLGLRGTHVTDAGLAHLEPLLQLEHVALGGTRITSAGLIHLRGLTRLAHLWLEGTKVDNAGLAHLAGLSNLKGLILFGTHVTGDGLAHLKRLVQLKGLMLGGLKVTNSNLASLQALTSLKSLWLDGTRISDAGLAHLKQLTKLQELNLNGTHVTDAGIERLQGSADLKTLYLGWTRITNATLPRLAEIHNLERLYLQGTKINDAGIKSLKGLTRLNKLDVSDTQVTQGGADELRKSLPNCEVVVKTVTSTPKRN
ncbi:MAG TPA: SUMF1/EgtB/PvdO family nonheme iron enzyme [Planctomycetaceae bacterium]|jgi:serine/threonine protein kinase/formylglycine-generating enzyme required for sulfatase activity|nr:SUMF1/EgtB/PvdO family nonheme iron enzyme [Planctomycetaceae bacterium]